MNPESRFAIYEQSHDYKIIPNIPIIVRCTVRNYQKVIKNLETPFPAALLAMLGDTMYTSAMDIEGCIFGYHNNDKISFVLNSQKAAPAYKNKIQKISSVVSSIMTNNFVKYYLAAETPIDIIGDLVFEVSVFGIPNISEVASYIIAEQQECFGGAVSRVAEFELPDARSSTVSSKIEMLADVAGFNINSLPAFLLFGSAAYKVQTTIQINGLDMTKNKWFLDRNLTDYTQNVQKILDILDCMNNQ